MTRRSKAQRMLVLAVPVRMLVLAVPLLAAACATPKKLDSLWPPQDFYLMVEAGINTDRDVEVRQKLQVWADGLVVYREAGPQNLTSSVEGARGIPVYKWLCAYRLAPESTRMLSRMLNRAGILGLPNVLGEVRGATGLWINVAYHAFDQRKYVRVNRRVYGPMNRILHIVNSFAPPGHPFTLPEMVGRPEAPHVIDVPEVRESVAGSLKFHLTLLRKFPKDPELLRDTFALACVRGDIPVAERCFGELSKMLGDTEEAQRLFPEPRDFDEVKHLREILDKARQGRALPSGGR